MIRKIKLSALVTLICLSFLLLAQLSFSQKQPGDGIGRLRVGGLTRNYLIHIPSSYDGKRSFAFIIALHGGGGQGKGMVRLTGLTNLSDREGFIVVYPDGIDRHWNDERETKQD